MTQNLNASRSAQRTEVYIKLNEFLREFDPNGGPTPIVVKVPEEFISYDRWPANSKATKEAPGEDLSPKEVTDGAVMTEIPSAERNETHEELQEKAEMGEIMQGNASLSDSADASQESDQLAIEDLYKKEIEKLRVEHEEALNQLRQECLHKIAGELGMQLDSGLKETRKILGNEIAKVLAGIFHKKLRQQAINQFADKLLSQALRAAGPLTIAGNAELIQALKAIPRIKELDLNFVENEGQELRLSYQDQIISTQLHSLLKELNEFVQ